MCTGLNKVVVDVGGGYTIADDTFMSREDYQRFCDQYGYKIVSWKEGE